MKNPIASLLLYLLCLTSGSGVAQIYSVTKATDDGRTSVENSLSWAIHQANKDQTKSTINISVSSLTLTAALPAITESCTISGASKLCLSSEKGGTTIHGQALSSGTFRAFTIRKASTSLMLQDLIITKSGEQSGTSLSGGGLYVTDSATIHLERCLFDQCWATRGAAIAADSGAKVRIHHCLFQNIRSSEFLTGSIHVSNATVFISGSTFRKNSGSSLFISSNLGKEDLTSSCTLTTSTFSDNGAYYNAGIITYGLLYLDHVTFYYNRATSGPAAIAYPAGPVLMSNTLFSSNFSDLPVVHSLFNYPDKLINGGGNIYLSQPSLLALADNGGCIPTHALSQTSSAINAGVPSAVTTDQRGVTFVGKPDAGAFEFVPFPVIAGFGSSTTTCAGMPFSVSAVVSNTISGSFAYTLTNGSEQVSGTSSNSLINQRLSGLSSGLQTVSLTVQDGYQSAQVTMQVTVTACSLALLSPTYSCQTGKLRFMASGGNGSPIEFKGAGITDWTTQVDSRIDSPGLAADIRNPTSLVEPITLYARQRNGDDSYTLVSYTWDAKAICAGSARLIAKPETALTVTVLGNPTLANSIEVLIESDQKYPLQVQVLTQQAQIISQQRITTPMTYERIRLPLGSSAGIYLLLITTSVDSKLVKVTKL